MTKNDISREWLDAEVTISREELGRIMANEIRQVLIAANTVFGKDTAKVLKELFNMFAAEVGTEVFKKLEKDERER